MARWTALVNQQVLPGARVATLGALVCPARAHPCQAHGAQHFATLLTRYTSVHHIICRLLSVDSKHVDTLLMDSSSPIRVPFSITLIFLEFSVIFVNFPQCAQVHLSYYSGGKN